MDALAQSFLDRWHEVVAQRDTAALDAILAQDVTMGAPPYWNKLEGKAVVSRLLGIIVHTIEDFRYQREWGRGRELALEFRGRLGSLELQGVDLITLNEQGRMQNLDVMIRPMNVLAELAAVVREKMLASA